MFLCASALFLSRFYFVAVFKGEDERMEMKLRISYFSLEERSLNVEEGMFISGLCIFY